MKNNDTVAGIGVKITVLGVTELNTDIDHVGSVLIGMVGGGVEKGRNSKKNGPILSSDSLFSVTLR